MNERDRAILDHLGLYRLSLRPILAKLFFEDNEAALANVLKRLREKKLVQVRQGLAGNLSYYQLTEPGAKQVGVPTDRASTFERHAFDRHLAMLWFCCADAERRYRLPADQVARAIPAAPHGDYCVFHEKAGPRMFRVYAPAAKTKTANLRRQVRELAADMASNPSTTPWVKTRSLGLAILVYSEGQKQDVTRLLRKPEAGSTIMTKVYCRVAVVPSISTLGRMTHELRTKPET